METASNGVSVDALVDIWRRRKWWAIVPFTIVITVVLSLLAFLPSVYSANALILIDGQQIPESYVKSTVTAGIESRLHTISQEILSRSRLERLIRDFKLYEDLQTRQSMDEVIAAMRGDINLNIRNAEERRWRRDRDEGSVAFSVSYTGPDPRKVMLVANTLASFYIEENLKVRERQAVGTTEFLQAQLLEVKKRLEEQERQMTQYKERHLGELPQQMDASVRIVERLQMQVGIASDALARAQERRALVSRQAAEEEIVVPGSAAVGTGPEGLSARVEALTRELAVLQTQFSDKYPDVIRLKQEIAALEEKLRTKPEENGPKKDAAALGRTAYGRRIQNELKVIDAEIRLLTADIAKAQRQMEVYQRRMENMPKREQELSGLTRDYTSTRELYASLLKRQEEASLAGNMEQRQKGEQFRILDPATYPQKPSGPQRARLFVMGLAASLGLAVAGVFVREKLDTSFHRVEDLKTFSSAPVLVTIPRIVTDGDRSRMAWRRRFGVAALAMTLVALVGSSYALVAGNEEIVRALTKPVR